MKLKTAISVALLAFGTGLPASAQSAPAAPQITMGNGEANNINMEALALTEGPTIFSEVRVDESAVKTFRAHSTALTFSEITIEKNGWVVLHPVIDGRPDGDMVSGFAYVPAGENTDVEVRIDHPAKTGDKFLVMLHSDVDQDRVFDFVFVEDGINVEDRAVFEGTHMIAHIFAIP
ncbi:MAG: hypothetical protein AAGK93_04790 [Pseudomonadota bacterium]